MPYLSTGLPPRRRPGDFGLCCVASGYPSVPLVFCKPREEISSCSDRSSRSRNWSVLFESVAVRLVSPVEVVSSAG